MRSDADKIRAQVRRAMARIEVPGRFEQCRHVILVDCAARLIVELGAAEAEHQCRNAVTHLAETSPEASVFYGHLADLIRDTTRPPASANAEGPSPTTTRKGTS